ncbi:MAG: sigma-70 family RNA polymerase sigma factor [Nigerium sp.]|nr:sigma-70 family RNA polymerase sigma factor [Nigerium sp.]
MEPPLTLELHDEWEQTVTLLQTVRRSLGPVPADDPIALLASATAGAVRANAGRQVLAPSLVGVRDALAEVAGRVETVSGDDRRRHEASLDLVAYELVHWVRIRTTNPQARDWLQAGETALDTALHARGRRPAIGVGLAAWQDALAAVQPVREAAIVQRSLALGHLTILRATHVLVQDAGRSGALDRTYADTLTGAIRDLARLHQSTLSQLASLDLGTSRVDQAVMLRLGGATRHLAAPPDGREPAHLRLDALLRSTLGQTTLVAQLRQDVLAQAVAGRINRLVLDYRANPGILTPADPSLSKPWSLPDASRPSLVRPPEAVALTEPVEPTVARGSVLTGEHIVALCRARDLGVAAATSDPARPPDILRGIDPGRWPQIVHEGRQAVASLVSAVTPMVYAQSRGAWNGEDLRGQLFVELMNAARRFDPQGTEPQAWPAYAWMTLKHARGHGVDSAGVVSPRTPRPTTVALGGWEPPSREPDPTTGIEQQQALQTIKQALDHLPDALREPLVEAMKGRSIHSIAGHLGVSRSTINRRIRAAREQVRDELGLPTGDTARVPFEIITGPARTRSTRLEEQRPRMSCEPRRRGPDR